MKHETHGHPERSRGISYQLQTRFLDKLEMTIKICFSTLVVFLFLNLPSVALGQTCAEQCAKVPAGVRESCVTACEQSSNCETQCITERGPDASSYCRASCQSLTGFGLKQVTGVATKLPSKETSVAALIGRILGGLLAFTGTIFFGLMLYGGGLWMSARGDENQVEKAKNVIIHAVIGLAVTAGSYVILQFIFQRFVTTK